LPAHRLTLKAALLLALVPAVAGPVSAQTARKSSPGSAAERPLAPLSEAECAKRGGWVNVEHGEGCNSGKTCAIRIEGAPVQKVCISFQGAPAQGARP